MTNLGSRWVTSNGAVASFIRGSKVMIVLERNGLECDAEQGSLERMNLRWQWLLDAFILHIGSLLLPIID